MAEECVKTIVFPQLSKSEKLVVFWVFVLKLLNDDTSIIWNDNEVWDISVSILKVLLLFFSTNGKILLLM